MITFRFRLRRTCSCTCTIAPRPAARSDPPRSDPPAPIRPDHLLHALSSDRICCPDANPDPSPPPLMCGRLRGHAADLARRRAQGHARGPLSKRHRLLRAARAHRRGGAASARAARSDPRLSEVAHHRRSARGARRLHRFSHREGARAADVGSARAGAHAGRNSGHRAGVSRRALSRRRRHRRHRTAHRRRRSRRRRQGRSRLAALRAHRRRRAGSIARRQGARAQGARRHAGDRPTQGARCRARLRSVEAGRRRRAAGRQGLARSGGQLRRRDADLEAGLSIGARQERRQGAVARLGGGRQCLRRRLEGRQALAHRRHAAGVHLRSIYAALSAPAQPAAGRRGGADSHRRLQRRRWFGRRHRIGRASAATDGPPGAGRRRVPTSIQEVGRLRA